MKHLLLAVVMLSVTALSLAAQEPRTVRVFVFAAADPSGFVDAEQKAREDSALDLRKALDSKRRAIEIVPTRDSADLVLEVLRRTKGVLDDKYRVEVRLTVPKTEYHKDFFGADDLGWRYAANQVADQVDDWLKDNRDRLLARRER